MRRSVPASSRCSNSPATPTCRSSTANAAAIAAGTKTYDLKLNGKSYPNPTRSYKRRCLLWLKAALAEVTGEARTRLEKILKQYHCWEPLQFSPGEEKMVPPLVPL